MDRNYNLKVLDTIEMTTKLDALFKLQFLLLLVLLLFKKKETDEKYW